ncbi:DUF4361 domain-containing protein [Maribellus luteus]|uniref:DUF4361 domain-containing protein n=1 Tax=Maribellus luteus TaxID=2305463 RepID=A0A399TA50_9BACT|nr:DUF4361 domain-containing protein [Maribellus luteus]RIJ50843.1 DUF4361 domain-containing protein [Maribellus luteus]
MKKNIYILAILVSTLTSCINWGLEELPLYDEVEITSFDLEHRYTTENANGVESVVFTKLNSSVDISSENAIITVTATIPPPTQIFTQEIRRSISLENIAGYFKLSPASKVEPLDGAPELGVPGDFSVERKYKVTAADGKTTKIWTVKVNPLPVINQYEGAYACTGIMYWDGTHFDGQGDLYNTSREVYLSSFDETTCVASHGASIWTGGYSLRLKVNADNSVTVTQHDAAGNIVGEMVPGAVNSYDPIAKKFTINYRSQTNDPYIGLYSDVFVLK